MKIFEEWTTSVKNSFEQRLSNPFLGSFTLSWVVINWRPVVYMIASDKNIEDKIEHVTKNFANFDDILLKPIVITLLLTMVLPWVCYAIQLTQEFANKKRLLKQYKYDAEMARAQEDVTRAKSNLEFIRAKQQLDIDFKKREKDILLDQEIKQAQNRHELDQKRMEYEFQERAQEHQINLDKRKRDADQEVEHRREIHQLELDARRSSREMELEERKLRMQLDAEERRAMINSR